MAKVKSCKANAERELLVYMKYHCSWLSFEYNPLSSKGSPDPAKSGKITFNMMKKKLAVKGWGSSNPIKNGVSFAQKTKSCRCGETKKNATIDLLLPSISQKQT